MTFETQFRSLVGRADKLEKNDLVIILRELLNLFNKEQKVQISGWKGKSSFEIKDLGDTVYVEKYKRDDKNEEARPQNFEINAEELNRLKGIIFSWFNYKKNIHLDSNGSPHLKSTQVAEYFYNKDWDNEIFNHRKTHNLYTIMLNVLDKKGLIRYSGRGNIYLK